MDAEALTARGDVEHWLWTLEREMDRLEVVHRAGARVVIQHGKITEGARRLFSQSLAQQLWVVLAAEHLATALDCAHMFPALVPERFPTELRTRVTLLRNIYEHWEESRPGKGSSIAAYQRAYPDRTPFSSSWSSPEGLRVGGILGLDELREVVDGVREALGTIPSPF